MPSLRRRDETKAEVLQHSQEAVEQQMRERVRKLEEVNEALRQEVEEHRRGEIEVHEARKLEKHIIDNTVREPMLVFDMDLLVQSANASFYHNFRVEPGETGGRLMYELGNGQWDIPALRELGSSRI